MDNNTKETIKQVAVKLFGLKGYDAVGVQEIVEAAKITKPTLYYYFGSKVGLLQAIIQENMEVLLKDLKEASKYEHEFFDSCKKIIIAEINFGKTHPDFFRFLITLLNSPDASEMRSVFLPYHKDLMRIYFSFFIDSANEFGNMRGKEALYATLFHTNTIAITMKVVRGDMLDDEDTIYKITHSFIYGFAD